MTAAVYAPMSMYLGAASGNLSATVYPSTAHNTNSAAYYEGIGVVSSLTSSTNPYSATLQFNLGSTSTSTSLTLRALAMANATSGTAKFTVNDGITARRWFNELLEAQNALVAKAAVAKTEVQRKALQDAAEAAWEIAEKADTELFTPPELGGMVIAFQAAANATRATAAIRKANEAILLARQELDDDDEEAIWLLLN